MAKINGTVLDDELYGTANADIIKGLDGDDDIWAGGGDDLIIGGYGLDYIFGGDGNDTIYGGYDNDNIYGDDGNDTLSGEDGSDFLSGGLGADTLSGGAGNDSLYGDEGADRLTGGDGYDNLTGGDGNDTLEAGNGDDFLDGGAGNDILDGGSGPDPFWPAEWFDEDVVGFYSADTGVVVNLALGTAADGTGGTDTLIDIEGIIGTEYDDTLIGGNAANDDWEYFVGNAGNDTIDGGSGFDIVWYNSERNVSIRGIVADMQAGTVRDAGGQIDTLTNIEAIVATDKSDQLLGSDGNNEFHPGGDDDYVNGRGGIDTVSYRYETIWTFRPIGIDADLARGTIYDMKGGIDQVVYVENVTGGRLADVIAGNGGANVLDGRQDDDVLKGRRGNDTLLGGDGQDILTAGAESDVLNGGRGFDTLRGGGGADKFVFDADCDEDTILDFKTGLDKIDVSAFGFASAADVLSRFTVLSPGAAMLDLGNDNYVIFTYVNTAQPVLVAGDILI